MTSMESAALKGRTTTEEALSDNSDGCVFCEDRPDGVEADTGRSVCANCGRRLDADAGRLVTDGGQDVPETLTLHATGPAEATLRDDHGDATIATTTEVELEATLEVDAEWIAEHGYVSKHSETSLYADDVAEAVCEARSGDDGTFVPLEDWTIEITAAFETWAAVAIAAAKGTMTIGGDDEVANAAFLVLDGLAEHAVDDRPRLVMLDIVDSYDPDDYTRAGILGTLAADTRNLPATTPTAEAGADD